MLAAFCRFADALNERLGRIGAWMFLPLAFLVFYEVISRYVFSKPTIWSWDIAFHFQTLLVLLGGGYLIIYAGHIRVDVFYARFSERTKRIIDLILSPFFFLGYGVLLWLAVDGAGRSFQLKEMFSTNFEPFLWPLKTILIIGVFLLLFQGIAQFIRDLRAVITGVYPKGAEGGAFASGEEKP